MNSRTPDLIIFDCDGVLVDSEIIACQVDAQEFTAAGFPTTTAEVAERYVGRSVASMVADMERRHGRRLPEDLPDRLLAATEARFAKELQPVKGIKCLLQKLTGARCVASSSLPRRIRQSLAVTGLLDFFAPHLFSASMVERGKPAPDLFLLAAEKMAVPAEACLVVEDSPFGIQAARAAGMPVIGFSAGGHCGSDHAERLRDAGANWLAADSRELGRLLEPGD